MKVLTGFLDFLRIGIITSLTVNALVFAGPVVEDFSDVSEWVNLTSEKTARGEVSKASFTTDGNKATLTCDADEGYTYILANLPVDTSHYKGVMVEVGSLSENAVWGMRFNWLLPATYEGKDTGHVYIPFPKDIVNTGDRISVLFMLSIGNKKPGTEPASISFNSISMASGPTVIEDKNEHGTIDSIKAKDMDKTQSPVNEKNSRNMPEYRVMSNDVLQVKVEGEPDFSQDYVYVYPEPEGLIKYSPLGDVRVVGLSLEQVEKRLTELLEDYLFNPKVTVTLKKEQK